MARTGRPKTTAADHERFTARLPHDLMAQLRCLAAQGERALNTELLRVVRAGLATLDKPSCRADHIERAHR